MVNCDDVSLKCTSHYLHLAAFLMFNECAITSFIASSCPLSWCCIWKHFVFTWNFLSEYLMFFSWPWPRHLVGSQMRKCTEKKYKFFWFSRALSRGCTSGNRNHETSITRRDTPDRREWKHKKKTTTREETLQNLTLLVSLSSRLSSLLLRRRLVAWNCTAHFTFYALSIWWCTATPTNANFLAQIFCVVFFSAFAATWTLLSDFFPVCIWCTFLLVDCMLHICTPEKKVSRADEYATALSRSSRCLGFQLSSLMRRNAAKAFVVCLWVLISIQPRAMLLLFVETHSLPSLFVDSLSFR